MEPMTPEERFTIIENLMKTAAEFHARHEESLARHEERFGRQEEWVARHEEWFARNEAETAKNTAAIRDLIVISRTLLDSQEAAAGRMEEMRAGINALRETQQVT